MHARMNAASRPEPAKNHVFINMTAKRLLTHDDCIAEFRLKAREKEDKMRQKAERKQEAAKRKQEKERAILERKREREAKKAARQAVELQKAEERDAKMKAKALAKHQATDQDPKPKRKRRNTRPRKQNPTSISVDDSQDCNFNIGQMVEIPSLTTDISAPAYTTGTTEARLDAGNAVLSYDPGDGNYTAHQESFVQLMSSSVTDFGIC
ncbi:hypothetical protein F443_14919 [Phytophthora nicotianae P1569]|uniref:Uncharacterized protein n=3 Tax=Phytophthora nicotianae TaxID=4792 RepID=V9EJW9_PHYNI|nr:hypothetical protein F443_14919 [Phytophthora nicotianae P1569]